MPYRHTKTLGPCHICKKPSESLCPTCGRITCERHALGTAPCLNCEADAADLRPKKQGLRFWLKPWWW